MEEIKIQIGKDACSIVTPRDIISPSCLDCEYRKFKSNNLCTAKKLVDILSKKGKQGKLDLQ